MKHSTLTAAGAAVSLVIALIGLASFHNSFAPIPQELKPYAGTATAVHSSSARFSQAHVSFRLVQANGDETAEISYLPKFSGFYELRDALRNGMTVEVMIGPEGPEDLWGLTLGSQVVLTPQLAYQDRRQDGYWSLAVFIGFLVTTCLSAREALQLRRHGR